MENSLGEVTVNDMVRWVLGLHIVFLGKITPKVIYYVFQSIVS